jgi:hypothetical protein
VLNTFTKIQSKIPFRLPNGHGYQLSLDRCCDIAGRRLAQLEVEYIGNVFARPTPTAIIVGELETLGRLLRNSPFGGQLVPSLKSKHAFFRKGAADHSAFQELAMASEMNA